MPKCYNLADRRDNYMRMRKKKCTPSRLEKYKDFFLDIKEGSEINFFDIFGNNNPVCLEIGAGKGDFITELSRRNPDINYIAFEKCSDVIAIAATKAEGIKNLRFANVDAEIIDRIFPKGSVNTIYLNFSDPWPKSGQKKRRLTHSRFLEKYKTVLKVNGEIQFKTDNVKLWEFSVEEIRNFPMKIKEIYNDLHRENPEGNIMTEYERRFSEAGIPIHKITAEF